MKLAQTLIATLVAISFVACSSKPKTEPVAKPVKTKKPAATKTADIKDIEIEAEEISTSELEAIGVKEKKIRELKDIQKDVILQAYQDSPDEFYVVEEEVHEEPGQNIIIENSNFKIEVASSVQTNPASEVMLTAESMTRLAQLAALLNSAPNAWASLTVRGFSDEFGNFRQNVDMAQRRALTVINVLRSQAVPQSKLSMRAYGAKKARKADDYSTWRKNHRILIVINSVNLNTYLAMQLKRLELEPINIAGPPPRVIVKEAKAKVFRISIEGIGSGFRTAKDRLSREAHSRLKKLAILLDLHREEWRHVAIHGHADVRGKSGYNLDLSNRRAFSVLKLLREQGVPAGRMSTTAFGEAKPLVNKNNAYAWQKNRRVELRISGVHKDTSLEKALKRLILPKKAVQ